MADEAQTTGAPTLPGPRAPAEPPKPKRTRARNGNRGGRRKLTPEEKAAAAAAREASVATREKQERDQQESRRQMARLASIGALTPHLLEPSEVGAISRFVLAVVQGVAPAAPTQGQG
jgi:hypothetical protein